MTCALMTLAGLVFRYSASSGIGRVVGHADRPAAEGDRAVVDERQQVVFDALLAREFVQFAVRRAVLGRRVGDQRDEHERPAGHPPAPARVARSRRVQPNTPAPQKTHRIAAARKA